MRGRWIGIALLAVLTPLAGCGQAADGEAADGADRKDEMVTEGAQLFALDTPRDVVTWTDTVAVITVTGDRTVSGEEPGIPEGGSWMNGRELSIELDQVLWSRPDSKQPPEAFECTGAGWWIQDGNVEHPTPMRQDGGLRFEMGKSYVAPVFLVGGEWGVSELAAFPLIDGTVEPTADQDTPFATAVTGKSIAEVGELMGGTAPQTSDAGDLRAGTGAQLKQIGVEIG